MHITEVFQKFENGKLVMDLEKAKEIIELAGEAQYDHGQWATVSLLAEDEDDQRSILRDFKKLFGQEVSFKNILDILENYDIWHRSFDDQIEDVDAVVRFVHGMVKKYGSEGQ